jgi:tripartite-type tricarboxylate transporter receptor subunit TctC
MQERMRAPTRRLVLAGGLASPMLARADTSPLPQGTVRILVGFPPGGGTDVMGRAILEALRRRGKLRNVIIENKAGATGTVAGEALKNAAPDGTTIMFAPSASTVQPVWTFRRLPYDPRTDFAGLTLTGTLQTAFVVAPANPARTFQDYVAWVKADPRRGSFGTTALGANPHFFGLMLGEIFGMPMEPVGYRGAAPLVSDLSAGHVMAGTGGLSDFWAHHQAGALRVLLTSGPRRASAAPDVPCIADLGHADRATIGFYGFFAPARTPRPVIAALGQELAAATLEPDARTALAGLGLEVETSTPEGFQSLVVSEIERWRPVIEKSGFKVD